MLDLFAGIGQMAYSYAKAGCRVQATDNDPTTVGVATHNMALAGLSASVGYRVADGPATLAAAVEAGQEFSIVHLDPPWRGTYKYDLAQPFTLEALAVDVPELVRLGLERARLVVLNLPHNALPSQLSELAAQAGCNVLIERLFISDFPASFSQAPAYFFGRSPAGPATAARPRTGTPPEPDPRRTAGRHPRIAPREMRHNAPQPVATRPAIRPR